MKKISSLMKYPLMLVFIFAFFSAQTQEDVLLIDINVSPAILNLQNQGQVVTVHTSISYSLVLGSSVELNGVEISSWKSDDRGYFVAKFLMESIKNLPMNINDYNTLTLRGITTAGKSFAGSENIKVINVIPSRK